MASKINLDLRNFKHVKSDKDTTTLQHKTDGHSITLAHKSLSPESQAQLKALSGISKQDETADQADQMKHQAGIKMAVGGMPQHEMPSMSEDMATYAKGGHVCVCKACGGSMSNYDEGGKVAVPKGQSDPAPQSNAEHDIPANVSTPSSIGDAVSRIKNAWADGGQVPDKPKEMYVIPGENAKPKENKLDYNQIRQEKRDMNRTEARRGIMPQRKKYAEGTQDVDPAVDNDTDREVQNNEAMGQQLADIGGVQDITGVPNEAMPKPQEKPQIPHDKVEIQKLYNNMMGSGGEGSPTDRMFNPGRSSFTFGPNGEPPQSFSPEAWKQAKQQYQTQQQDAAGMSAEKQQEDMETKQRQQQDDQVRMEAGLPPLLPKQNDLPPPDMPKNQNQPQDNSMAQPPVTRGPQDDMGMNAYTNTLQGGLDQYLAGLRGGANAQAQLGAQEKATLQRNQIAQQSILDDYKKRFDQLEAERQAFISDIQNGYIDPNQYWKGTYNPQTGEMEGGHSKIAAGIGMILAGFNPTNRPNAAIEMMNHLMDQNIQAQQANLSAKGNLLAANLHQFGNMKDALMATRIMQADVLASQLEQAAAAAKGPLAKSAAMQAAGQVKMQYAPLARQFAMQGVMMGLTQQPSGDPDMDVAKASHIAGYMRAMGNIEGAKDIESHIVPGVGVSKDQAVPQEVRQQLIGYQKLQNAANDLQNFVKTHTTLNPYSPDYAVGAQKAQALQSYVREGFLGTVYKTGEQPLLDKFVSSNPAGALKLLQTEPRLNELLRANESQMNLVKQNYGLPAKHTVQAQQPDQHQAAAQWLKDPKNKSDPNYQAVLQRYQQSGK